MKELAVLRFIGGMGRLSEADLSDTTCMLRPEEGCWWTTGGTGRLSEVDLSDTTCMLRPEEGCWWTTLELTDKT